MKNCSGFTVGSSFNRSDKRFDRMWKNSGIFITLVFILIVSVWIIIAIAAYKGIKAVNKTGLKHIIEEVYNGKDNVRSK